VKTRLLLALFLLALVAPPAGADSLSSTAAWNPWVAPTQGNPIPFSGPAPFWDNRSHDGTQLNNAGNNCNIGFWVSGTGNCDAPSFYGGAFLQNSPGTTAGFLGDGTATFTMLPDGNADGWQVSAGVGVSALSGDVPTRGTTEFGWFPVANPNQMHPLLQGGNAVVGFPVPSGEYAFYLFVTDLRSGVPVTRTYRSNDPALDAIGRSHFTAFQLSEGHYIIGIEDKTGARTWSLSDYDYNDLVVEIRSSPVPEPASVLLLGMGLLGGAAILRKRRS
jgi:hypothetical protein